jgi:hypothetical protein
VSRRWFSLYILVICRGQYEVWTGPVERALDELMEPSTKLRLPVRPPGNDQGETCCHDTTRLTQVTPTVRPSCQLRRSVIVEGHTRSPGEAMSNILSIGILCW